jgi:hypothetical protein
VFAGVRRPADADAAVATHSNITPLILDVTREDSVTAAAQQVAVVLRMSHCWHAPEPRTPEKCCCVPTLECQRVKVARCQPLVGLLTCQTLSASLVTDLRTCALGVQQPKVLDAVHSC